jgi:hypothetical protein
MLPSQTEALLRVARSLAIRIAESPPPYLGSLGLFALVLTRE